MDLLEDCLKDILLYVCCIVVLKGVFAPVVKRERVFIYSFNKKSLPSRVEEHPYIELFIVTSLLGMSVFYFCWWSQVTGWSTRA